MNSPALREMLTTTYHRSQLSNSVHSVMEAKSCCYEEGRGQTMVLVTGVLVARKMDLVVPCHKTYGSFRRNCQIQLPMPSRSWEERWWSRRKLGRSGMPLTSYKTSLSERECKWLKG